MGSRYLTDMAHVLRSAGLKVTEVSGWQHRARGSGGYNGGPEAIMVHHTASTTSAKNDVNYMCFGSSVAPIANRYMARDGVVWVMAGGATNTNGRGGPIGTIPQDGMNSRAIGIEIGNGGTGEPYPYAQQEATIQSVRALSQAYNVSVHQIWSHFEYSPGRKIDPYGPSRWNGDRVDFWNMNAFRHDVQTSVPPPAPGNPPTDPGDDDAMLVNLVQEKGQPAVYAQYSNGTKTWVPNQATLNLIKGLNPGMDVTVMPNDEWMIATGVVVGPLAPGTDGWGMAV
jgi:hypothetical protein